MLYRQAREEVERNRRGAARHEADSIARYMAAQDQRDHARSLSDDRNKRLRGERMQRLMEMQTDDEAGTHVKRIRPRHPVHRIFIRPRAQLSGCINPIFIRCGERYLEHVTLGRVGACGGTRGGTRVGGEEEQVAAPGGVGVAHGRAVQGTL
jgi:hypothetical protein